MARDIIDDRLIGALHLRALTLRGIEHDPAVEHLAVQAGTIDALMEGRYEGDATLAQVMAHGSLKRPRFPAAPMRVAVLG